MNEKELRDFIKAYYDFMNHAEVEELYHEGRKMYEMYAKEKTKELEVKAAELEVTCDYYMMEFL